jgi:hypothetical protein
MSMLPGMAQSGMPGGAPPPGYSGGISGAGPQPVWQTPQGTYQGGGFGTVGGWTGGPQAQGSAALGSQMQGPDSGSYASSPLRPGNPSQGMPAGSRGPGSPRPVVPPMDPFGGRGQQVPPLSQWQPAQGTTDYQGFYDASEQRVRDDIRQGTDTELARAGFSGNRYSSSAQEGVARQIGDAYNRLGEQFAGVSYQHGRDDSDRVFRGTQSELDRSLQATGMGQQADQFFAQLMSQNRNAAADRGLRGIDTAVGTQQATEQMMQGRLGALGGAGQYEQGRGDQFNNLGYTDFMNSRWGALPQLAPFFGGQAAPSQPNPIVQQEGPNQAMQWASIIGPIIGMAMMSDERLKTDVHEVGRAGKLPLKSWTWKHSGEPGAGVMAQDVERLDPEAVLTDPFSGIKMVRKDRAFDLILAGMRSDAAKRVGSGRGHAQQRRAA